MSLLFVLIQFTSPSAARSPPLQTPPPRTSAVASSSRASILRPSLPPHPLPSPVTRRQGRLTTSHRPPRAGRPRPVRQGPSMASPPPPRRQGRLAAGHRPPHAGRPRPRQQGPPAAVPPPPRRQGRRISPSGRRLTPSLRERPSAGPRPPRAGRTRSRWLGPQAAGHPPPRQQGHPSCPLHLCVPPGRTQPRRQRVWSRRTPLLDAANCKWIARPLEQVKKAHSTVHDTCLWCRLQRR